ncbi:MAG: phosphoglucosamine mutase [Oscillospiraceae bacterium]
MGKIFGTDGARGVAGADLTADLAMAIGKATATVLGKNDETPLIILGKDTRKSSDMLELAICSGLTSCGANVIKVGVLPTPAVAYLVKYYNASAGIMISASHNPYEYNGIKIFGSKGYKLSDSQENEIEEMILTDNFCFAEKTFDKIGTYTDVSMSHSVYVQHILKSFENTKARGLKVLVDCCNGSAYATAKEVFDATQCDYTLINFEPDGLNINTNCGSTHIENLSQKVIDGKFDLAIAFDGDADRCLAVDNMGEIVSGDELMAIFAKYMSEKGLLKNNTVVATVMSNLGFFKFGENNGVKVNSTKVGDRYVLENMLLEGHNLGGEDSGHLIFLDYMTTGDGQLSALQLLKVLSESGKSLHELKSVMKKYPQLLINIKVTNHIKEIYATDACVKNAIEEETKRLGDKGRILVRPSGTEPLIRVMVEAQTNEDTSFSANKIADEIKKLK